ncbi:DUF535 family protein [Helicobacter cetorum]|uniref:DUF535 family protein n=1 Tax=Helicobacter cetorum TaxID=138563 RepID=UPI000CF14F90|nr:DUF535 family protein [Helicobacter cetorum]
MLATYQKCVQIAILFILKALRKYHFQAFWMGVIKMIADRSYEPEKLLMGVKVKTIESLLPKENRIFNMRACLAHFCDFRFNNSQNLACLTTDMQFLQNLYLKNLETHQIAPFLEIKTTTFHTATTEHGKYEFKFELLDFIFEGLWGITIQYTNETDKHFLYKISFCKTHHNHLLIGSIQGTKDLNELHYQFFAKYCKTRPNFFLIKLAKELGEVLGCSKVLGIPNNGQISLNSNNQKVFQDHDKFFASCEAQLVEVEGFTYWEIPKIEKAIEEYPQKHRSKQRARRKIMQTFRESLQDIIVLNPQNLATNPPPQKTELI